MLGEITRGKLYPPTASIRPKPRTKLEQSITPGIESFEQVKYLETLSSRYITEGDTHPGGKAGRSLTRSIRMVRLGKYDLVRVLVVPTFQRFHSVTAHHTVALNGVRNHRSSGHDDDVFAQLNEGLRIPARHVKILVIVVVYLNCCTRQLCSGIRSGVFISDVASRTRRAREALILQSLAFARNGQISFRITRGN